MFEDKAVAAVMEPMTDIVQSASEGRSALSDAHDKVSHLAGVDMPMEEPVAPPAAPDPEWPEQPSNFVALSKLPHPLPAPPAAKSTDQAGRAKMAGQPWQVSPALHESAWLPLVVGAQHKNNTATPCTADGFAK